MPASHIRYRPNRRSFGEMMVSDQVRGPAMAAAREVAAQATADQKISSDPYTVSEVPADLVIDGNPRAIAIIEGNDRLHAVEEFGSGTASTGSNPGKPRKQGGYSTPNRTLATAAAKILPPAPKPPK